MIDINLDDLTGMNRDEIIEHIKQKQNMQRKRQMQPVTLDEAIDYCEHVADYDAYTDEQQECQRMHMHLAEWLRELKAMTAAVEEIHGKPPAGYHPGWYAARIRDRETRINLNETIKVKLTDLGQQIYYHKFDAYNSWARENGKLELTPHWPKQDKDGKTSFALWQFIELYGPHIGITAPNVILPLEIIYEQDKKGQDDGKD